MKRIFIVLSIIFVSISARAQHTLQMDDGLGHYGIFSASGLTLGVTTYTFDPSGGLVPVVPPPGIPALMWLTQAAGNVLTGGSPTTPNERLGSGNDYDVVMMANNVEKFRLISGGGVWASMSSLSTSLDLVVSNAGVLETRTVGSLALAAGNEPFITFAADGGTLTNNRVLAVGTGLSIVTGGADNSNTTLDANIQHDASLTGIGITGNLLALNMANPNSWTALQTFSSVDINGGAIDGTTIGSATPSTGAFTTLNSSGVTTFTGIGGLGVVHSSAGGVLSSSPVVLTSEVSGVLPIANGGTNSGAALAGSSIMISNGTQIVQGAAGTATTVLHGNAGGLLSSSAVVSADIQDNTVANVDLRQSAALSVIGRSANTVGDVADITAGAADQVLRVNTAGTILGFGTLAPGAFTPGANNTFLTTNGAGVVGWLGFNRNATLVGDGITTALGLDLANANTWTATQTFSAVGNGIVVTTGTDLQGSVANSSGDLTFGDNIVVTGTSDLQGQVGSTVGDLQLADNVDVTGDLDVGAGNFTVAAATGNTNIGGTLDVGGATTLALGLGVVHSSAGGLLSSSAVVSADIQDNTVANVDLRQSAALSVIGRSANTVGDVADITAGAADQVLRVNTAGTILGFGTLAPGAFTPGANNTFLTTNGAGVVGWLGFNRNATLVGDGITTALGLNLANANTWTATQTFDGVVINTTLDMTNGDINNVGNITMVGNVSITNTTLNVRINDNLEIIAGNDLLFDGATADISNAGGDVTVNDNLVVTGTTDLNMGLGVVHSAAGGLLSSSAVVSADIQDNTVADVDLRQSAALSVIGNSTNALANVADITAGAADQVLRVNTAGNALGFGTLAAGAFTPGANNTFLTTSGAGVVAWTGFNRNATLVGDGITTALGLDLANANTWTATQTFPTTAAQGDAIIASLNAGTTGTVNANMIGNGLTNAQVNNDLTISGGTVDNSPVGATTASTGRFTTIEGTALPAASTSTNIVTSNAGVLETRTAASLSGLVPVVTNATLVGDGTTGTPLGLNLANANTWTATQTFSAVGNGIVVTTGTDLQGSVANSSGDLTFGDNIVVTGTSDLQGQVGSTVGDLQLGDNVDVTGDLDVGAGNFTVTAATGNTNIGGTLTVVSTSDFGDDITISGNVLPNGATRTLGVDATRWADLFLLGASLHIGPNGGTLGNTELSLGYAANTGSININGGASEVDITTATTDVNTNLNVDGSTVHVGTLDQQGIISNSTGNVTITDNLALNGTSVQTFTTAGNAGPYIVNTITGSNTNGGAISNTSVVGLRINASEAAGGDDEVVGGDFTATRAGAGALAVGLRLNASGAGAGNNLAIQVQTGDVRISTLTASSIVRTDASSSLTTGAINLATEVTGVLPIANGGTNSSAALNNDRIMVSSGGAIVEAAALTDGQLLIGSTGAAPVAAALTGTANQITVTNGAGSITLSTPQNINAGASPTFAGMTLTGIGGLGIVHSSAGGVLSSSAVVLTSEVSGVLPIANGGTNSSAALNNDRIMVSSGGAIVEAAALTDGQLLIGSTGAAPVAAAITGTANQITVTNGAGSITLSTPQDIATTSTPTFGGMTLNGTLNMTDDDINNAGNITMNGNVSITNSTLNVRINDNLEIIAGNDLLFDGAGADISNASGDVEVNDDFTVTGAGTTTTVQSATVALPNAGTPAVGRVLTSDGSGNATWQNPSQTVVYGENTPAAIAANTNDYALLDPSSTFYRISSTGAFNLTGIVAGAGGRSIILVNVGANVITITHQDAASAAANRIIVPGGGNIAMAADGVVTLVYDSTTARWRVTNIQ